jgi:lipopolysaccharide biosynthesis regulator YciM
MEYFANYFIEFLPYIIGVVVCLLGGYILGKSKAPTNTSNTYSASYVKGLNYMIANLPDKAIAEFTKAVKINSDTIEIYLRLGNLFRDKGEVERAIRIHQSIILRPVLSRPEKIKALTELGMDYLKAGFIDRSIETYFEILVMQSDHLEAHIRLAELYEEEKNWEKAFSFHQKILRLKKSNDQQILANIQVEIGKSYLEEQDIKQAIKRFNTAILLDKQSTRAYLLLGQIYMGREKIRKAIDIWKDIIDRDLPFASLTYKSLEEAYQAIGLPQQAENIYRDVLQRNPEYIRTRLALAKFYYRKGDSHLAIEELREVLKRGIGFLAARDYLFKILVDQVRALDVLPEYHELFTHLEMEDIPYRCRTCGYESWDSPWKCPQCRLWNSYIDPLYG